MEYTVDKLKEDLHNLEAKEFYKKYILKSNNWYFETVLSIPEKNVIDVMDDFKEIVSSNLDVDFNGVTMVGSGKLGYSLAPKKKFKQFELDTESENKSDIDIAIVSPEIFDYFWRLLRQSFTIKDKYAYDFISTEIYRGYLNESSLKKISECRKEWQLLSSKCNKMLKSKLYFKHNITYRIYRNWKDFEEYNLISIKSAQREVRKNEGF